MSKASDAFRTISEVSDELDIPKHVLRFWEVKFPQIRPMKRGGGRRYYRPEDLELLRGIRHLLHAEKYTIKGVQKILREQGIDQVKAPVPSKAAASSARGKRAKRATGATAATPLVDISVRPVERTLSTVSAVNSSEKLALIKEAIAELEACRAMLKGDAIPKAGRRTGRRTAPNAARA